MNLLDCFFSKIYLKITSMFFKKKLSSSIFNLKFFKIQLSKQVIFCCIYSYFLNNFFLKINMKTCFYENKSICTFISCTCKLFSSLNLISNYFKKNLFKNIFISEGFNFLNIRIIVILFFFFLTNLLKIFIKYFKFIIRYFQPIVLKIVKDFFCHYKKKNKIKLTTEPKKPAFTLFFIFFIKFYSRLFILEKKKLKKNLNALKFSSFKNFGIF